MRYRWRIWVAAALLTMVVIVGAKANPYSPGELLLTRLVQGIAPENPQWAQVVTATAKAPWNVVLLVGSMGAAWWLAGWRGALLALVSFLGVWLGGPWLNSWIARPRPSPELIRVIGSPSGYSAPSIFGLTYGAVFVFLGLLAVVSAEGRVRQLAPIACGVLLVVGGSARVALGAHWPSDILLSYLIAGCWAGLLLLGFAGRR